MRFSIQYLMYLKNLSWCILGAYMLLLRYVIVWCMYVPIVLCECHVGCFSCNHNAGRCMSHVYTCIHYLDYLYSLLLLIVIDYY